MRSPGLRGEASRRTSSAAERVRRRRESAAGVDDTDQERRGQPRCCARRGERKMTAHARASSTNRARQPRGGLAALSGPIPNADLVRAARAGALASPTTPRSPLAGGLHLPQYPPSGARCEAREQHTERSYSEKLLHASSGIATAPTADRLTPRHSLASVARVFPNHLSCSPGLHGPGAPCARAPRPEHLFADTTMARRGESSANGAHALDATFATFATQQQQPPPRTPVCWWRLTPHASPRCGTAMRGIGAAPVAALLGRCSIVCVVRR